MLPDALTRAHRRTWRAVVIRGLLAVGFGGFILAKPLDSLAAFALVIAIWALTCGATDIVHAFDIRPTFGLWWMLLLSGVVSVGFGVAAFRGYPGLSLPFAVRWLSFWLALTGTLGLAVAVEQERAGLPWGWSITLGVIGIGASILALASPPRTLAAITELMAGFGVVSGIALLTGALRLNRLETGALRREGLATGERLIVEGGDNS